MLALTASFQSLLQHTAYLCNVLVILNLVSIIAAIAGWLLWGLSPVSISLL
jgi:hypothetical protein